jgi:mRNA interferase RelE/StbE
MPKIEVVIGPAAERELRKISKHSLKSVVETIDQLEEEMRPHGVEKIRGHPGFYRLRAGKFRVIYYPMSKYRVVVLVVSDRKDAYKNMNCLEDRLRSVG